MRYGLVLSGLDKSEILKYYGPMMNVGIGFQIRDDVLDLTMKKGDEKGKPVYKEQKFGKDYLGDLAEGKRTIPLVRLYEVCDPSERTFLDENIRNGPYDPRFKRKEVSIKIRKKIVEMMNKHEVIKYANKLAKHYVNEGNNKLRELVNPQLAQPLFELNNYCVDRNF